MPLSIGASPACLRARESIVPATIAHDFDHVASCHAEWRAGGVDESALARGYAWLLDLDGTGGFGHVAEFAWRHPVITCRFVKEQIATQRTRKSKNA